MKILTRDEEFNRSGNEGETIHDSCRLLPRGAVNSP
jgi:hypothetical protein